MKFIELCVYLIGCKGRRGRENGDGEMVRGDIACDDKMRSVARSVAAIFALIEFGFNRQSAPPCLPSSLLPSPPLSFPLPLLALSFFVISPSEARFGMRRSYADEAERGQRRRQRRQYI